MTTERFKTLTEAEMTPEQRRLVQAIVSGPRKRMSGGPFQAFLRSPELGDIAQQFGAHVRFKSTLPDPLKEFAEAVVQRLGNRIGHAHGKDVVFQPEKLALLPIRFAYAEPRAFNSVRVAVIMHQTGPLAEGFHP